MPTGGWDPCAGPWANSQVKEYDFRVPSSHPSFITIKRTRKHTPATYALVLTLCLYLVVYSPYSFLCTFKELDKKEGQKTLSLILGAL